MIKNKNTIVLLRHGSYSQPIAVPSAHLPHPLTKEGFEQARSCIDALKAFSNDNDLTYSPTIHSSRMLRAWQTSNIISENLAEKKMPIAEFDNLAERSLGSLANLSTNDIEKITDIDPRLTPLPIGWKRDPWFKLPFQGTESLMESGMRVAMHFQKAMNDLENSSYDIQIVVGHGGAFRHAAAHLGIIPFPDVKRLSMYHCQPIFITRENDEWKKISGEWKVRSSQDQLD